MVIQNRSLKREIRDLFEKSENKMLSESADFEAEQIVRWAEKFQSFSLTPKEENADAESVAEQKARAAALRRLNGEPLQYVLGEWDFFGLTLHVGEGVLIPRPETEILVERAVVGLSKTDIVVDLCSGSGCIPIALARETGARCFGVEISADALKFFKENILLTDTGILVKPIQGDVLAPNETLLSKLPQKCSLITANPPYLTVGEMDTLQTEVRCEPKLALFGGDDGLDFYRVIFKEWKKLLVKGGRFIVETGDKQAQTVERLMQAEGFECEIIKDYNKIERIVEGVYSDA